MGAGDFNRRILLRLWADTPNAAFGLDKTFDAGRALWAKVEPVHSLAIRAGMQTGEVPTHLFFVRYASGTQPESIGAGYVIEYQARRYRVIDAIDVDGKRQTTRISAIDLGVIA